MKKSLALVVLLSVLTLSACVNQKGNTSSSSSSSSSSGGKSSSSSHGGSSSSGQTKYYSAAHTLSDGAAPFTVGGDGEEVSASTWEAFRVRGSSLYNKHYNFTYNAYVSGSTLTEKYTQNGYYMVNSQATLIYERKSGNTFYSYNYAGGEYQRTTTTFNLQNAFTNRIDGEIYTHMFDMSNYTFNEGLGGVYIYDGGTFTTNLTFQNGYLTHLYYRLYSPLTVYEITAVFDTTIEIPKSYYYN